MRVKRYRDLFESVSSIYDDVLSRINQKNMKKYMSENNWDDDDDIESVLDDFLYDKYSVRIMDDVIEFDYLTPEITKLIGKNYVKLYHYTSDKFIDDIKREGLVSGKIKTNPYQNSYSGIYLTTRVSGGEIDGYKFHIRKHGGNVVRIELKMRLSEIKPDLDDVDLVIGKSQFISDNISPDRIIEIENI